MYPITHSGGDARTPLANREPRSRWSTVSCRGATLPTERKRDWLTVAIFGVVVVALIVVGVTSDWVTLHKLVELVGRIRDARGTFVIFTVLFIVVAALGLPITPMILVGGALFGIWRGALLNWGAAIVGAVGGYYLARLFGKNALRHLVERMTQRSVKFSGPGARKALFRLRLIPLSPFGGLNFAAGLAGMSLPDFVIATALGTLPSIAVFTYFAAQVLGGGAKARHDAIVHTVVAALVLLLLSFAPTLWDRLTHHSAKT
jgi:uncharacterized membrane protein YdjX (TVP38/TMEM64 family)